MPRSQVSCGQSAAHPEKRASSHAAGTVDDESGGVRPNRREQLGPGCAPQRPSAPTALLDGSLQGTRGRISRTGEGRPTWLKHARQGKSPCGLPNLLFLLCTQPCGAPKQLQRLIRCALPPSSCHQQPARLASGSLGASCPSPSLVLAAQTLVLRTAHTPILAPECCGLFVRCSPVRCSGGRTGPCPHRKQCKLLPGAAVRWCSCTTVRWCSCTTVPRVSIQLWCFGKGMQCPGGSAGRPVGARGRGSGGCASETSPGLSCSAIPALLTGRCTLRRLKVSFPPPWVPCQAPGFPAPRQALCCGGCCAAPWPHGTQGMPQGGAPRPLGRPRRAGGRSGRPSHMGPLCAAQAWKGWTREWQPEPQRTCSLGPPGGGPPARRYCCCRLGRPSGCWHLPPVQKRLRERHCLWGLET